MGKQETTYHSVNLGNWATVVLIEIEVTTGSSVLYTGNVLVQWFVRPLVSLHSTHHLFHEGCSVIVMDSYTVRFWMFVFQAFAYRIKAYWKAVFGTMCVI